MDKALAMNPYSGIYSTNGKQTLKSVCMEVLNKGLLNDGVRLLV